MILQKIRWAVLMVMVMGVTGCVSYEPMPLSPVEIVEAIHNRRKNPEGEGVSTTGPLFTLEKASQWMREHGPEVREAVAAYETALARAQVPTPWPNPGLEAGPAWGFGDAVSLNKTVGLGAIGLTIPLSGRLAREDELNQAVAEAARVEGLARYRELYLELRSAYTRLVVAQERRELRRQIAAAAGATVEIARRLVTAGAATAIDLALFELESARSDGEVLRASQDIATIEAAVSELVGVHASLFRNLPPNALPVLSRESLDLGRLRELLINNHSQLGRLRAQYEVAERSLHLEITRQYPDLQIGPSYGGETGEKKTILGLSLGIELPIFDRNQQAIAQALKKREEIRLRYEAESNRALARLEGAFEAVNWARRRKAILEEKVFPQAETSVRIARESMSAGTGNALRLLDAERSFRQIQVEILEADLDLREAWSALEQAVGYPIVVFPSEKEGRELQTPDGLDEPADDAMSDDDMSATEEKDE